MTDYPKMDAEIKARWVKALRSGEYVQTRNALWRVRASDDGTDPAGNCCLGVLARVEGLKTYESSGLYRGVEFQGSHNEESLPDAYCASIDLDLGAHGFLVLMNDDGASFERIADWIEQNL